MLLLASSGRSSVRSSASGCTRASPWCGARARATEPLDPLPGDTRRTQSAAGDIVSAAKETERSPGRGEVAPALRSGAA
jgi:hypothetical protein